jgi:hypothetical protein
MLTEQDHFLYISTSKFWHVVPTRFNWYVICTLQDCDCWNLICSILRSKFFTGKSSESSIVKWRSSPQRNMHRLHLTDFGSTINCKLNWYNIWSLGLATIVPSQGAPTS